MKTDLRADFDEPFLCYVQLNHSLRSLFSPKIIYRYAFCVGEEFSMAAYLDPDAGDSTALH